MIGDSERAQMRADMAGARGDLSLTVTLRRGTTTLAGQAARITGPGRGQTQRSEGGQAAHSQALLFGAVDMDVAVDDRFTLAGVIYRVVFVRPERTVSTVSELEMVR